eukprot:3193725-Prymnesium_polylepis.2
MAGCPWRIYLYNLPWPLDNTKPPPHWALTGSRNRSSAIDARGVMTLQAIANADASTRNRRPPLREPPVSSADL